MTPDGGLLVVLLLAVPFVLMLLVAGAIEHVRGNSDQRPPWGKGW